MLSVFYFKWKRSVVDIKVLTLLMAHLIELLWFLFKNINRVCVHSHFKHVRINAVFADQVLQKIRFFTPYLLSAAWFVYNFGPQE